MPTGPELPELPEHLKGLLKKGQMGGVPPAITTPVQPPTHERRRTDMGDAKFCQHCGEINTEHDPSPARDDAEKVVCPSCGKGHEGWDDGHLTPGLWTLNCPNCGSFQIEVAAPDELTALRAELDKALRLKDRYYEQFTERGKRFDDLRERIRALAYGEPDIAVTADSPPPHTKYIDQDRLRAALGDA